MGVLNVTPDSFFDGGRLLRRDAAVRHGLGLFEAGADVVDVGGESTRPGGAAGVDAARNAARAPVIGGCASEAPGPSRGHHQGRRGPRRAGRGRGPRQRRERVPLRPGMAPLVAERGVPAVVMHLRGDFEGMHRPPAIT